MSTVTAGSNGVLGQAQRVVLGVGESIKGVLNAIQDKAIDAVISGHSLQLPRNVYWMRQQIRWSSRQKFWCSEKLVIVMSVQRQNCLQRKE